MKTLETIEQNEILVLANQIKEAQRIERLQKESERQGKVFDLLDTISELHPDKSSSIIKDLFKICRAKDFNQTFVHLINGTINVCKYDGKTLINYKQNGDISVRSLNYKIFVEKFGADFSNYYKKGAVRFDFVEPETGFDLTSSECFEAWKNAAIDKFMQKGSENKDTNLTTIYKLKLQVIGLERKNKSIK